MKKQDYRSENMIIKALILDLDGTLMHGLTPLPGAAGLFDTLRSLSIPFLVVTNNATRQPEEYCAHFAEHGIHILPEEILTAGMATALHLKKELDPGSSIYMIGQQALRQQLEETGFHILPDASGKAAAVVAGGDPDLTYSKLKDASLHLQKGSVLFGTNPDVVYPTEEGLVPETGTTLAALEAAAGVKARVIGKPFPALFNLAVERLNSTPDTTAVVGDRLETDILGGRRAGLRTILITTGVDGRASIDRKGIHPDFVVDGLEALCALLKRSEEK